MTKLIDQPGVAELVAKRAAAAIKKTLADAVRTIKAESKECIGQHNDGTIYSNYTQTALKSFTKVIVAKLKGDDAA